MNNKKINDFISNNPFLVFLDQKCMASVNNKIIK